MGAGLGRSEEVVTPVGGKEAGESGVVGVGDEPPALFGLEAQHGDSFPGRGGCPPALLTYL